LIEKGFLPTCRAEMERREWDELDVLFVNGDAYVDHPAFGVPLLARLLEAEGFRVGIIAQPDWRNPEALQTMGRPRLFAAVSSGAMDSMVNHYTALKRLRHDDAYTPGGRAGARPNRAVIPYTAAVKGAHRGLPVIIGGLEASLRRLAHYDYWDDKVRRSLLVDSKADLLIYGMAERPLLEVAKRLKEGESIGEIRDVRGTAYVSSDAPDGIELPSFEEVADSQNAYLKAYKVSQTAHPPSVEKPLVQAHGKRHVVVLPPAAALDEAELDRLYRLPFKRLPHPSYKEPIPAYTQIRFSLTSHRGCCGGCSFCAIAAHQGKQVQSRSEASLLEEARSLLQHPEFSGALSDVGGPTANMYGVHCSDAAAHSRCLRSSCLYPSRCRHLAVSSKRAVRMLERLRHLPGIRHVPVASGVRHDLLEEQPEYAQALIEHHVGGLLKIAPETLSSTAAQQMYKPDPKSFARFLEMFRHKSGQLGRRYGVVPYLIAGHPGCSLDDAIDTALFLKRHRLKVEQVQIFTPTPGTRSTCMWYTGHDPDSGNPLSVPGNDAERKLHKAVLLFHLPENRGQVERAFRQAGRGAELCELYAGNNRGRGGKRGGKRRR